MSTNSKLIPIDGAKLRRLLALKNVDLGTASKAIGYEKSFVCRCVTRGSMSPHALRSIELVYGILPEDYKKPEPKPEQKPEPEQLSFQLVEAVKEARDVIDYERLWKVIYTAVYEATKKVWSE